MCSRNKFLVVFAVCLSTLVGYGLVSSSTTDAPTGPASAEHASIEHRGESPLVVESVPDPGAETDRASIEAAASAHAPPKPGSDATVATSVARGVVKQGAQLAGARIRLVGTIDASQLRVIEAAIVEHRPEIESSSSAFWRKLNEIHKVRLASNSTETYQAGEVIPPAVEGEFLARGFIRDPATGISTWRVSRVRLTDDISFAQACHRYHTSQQGLLAVLRMELRDAIVID